VVVVVCGGGGGGGGRCDGGGSLSALLGPTSTVLGIGRGAAASRLKVHRIASLWTSRSSWLLTRSSFGLLADAREHRGQGVRTISLSIPEGPFDYTRRLI